MTSSLRLDELACLIEACLNDPDPRQTEGRLMHLVVEQGWAQAAALFRAPQDNSPDSKWLLTRAAGPADLLPDGQKVAAILRGELPVDLPLGRRVLFAGIGIADRALALGGFELDEAELDGLGAAFEVLARLEPVEPGDLDRWHPPLPGFSADEGWDRSA
jgi:hypothetical protein